jgi:hypothetical protein
VSHPREADLPALVAALHDAGVEFLIVGGAAGVLHGSGVTTQDLDIVPRRDPDNARRLLALVERLGGWLDEPMKRRIPARESDFLGRGQINLTTSLGPMDVLCVLHDGRGFDELFERSVLVEDGERRYRILDLPDLIQVKAAANRPKDRIVVPILLALLEERTKRERGEAG